MSDWPSRQEFQTQTDCLHQGDLSCHGDSKELRARIRNRAGEYSVSILRLSNTFARPVSDSDDAPGHANWAAQSLHRLRASTEACPSLPNVTQGPQPKGLAAQDLYAYAF